MPKKTVPFTIEDIKALTEKYPTPFYIYDEKAIRDNIRVFLKEFSWIDFKEYFAVKATPNPSIMKILSDEGCGMDCSSMPELVLAESIGCSGRQIMFTSNDTPKQEYEKAFSLGAVINLDDYSHIKSIEHMISPDSSMCLRYNPGNRRGNEIIGQLKDSKFGMSREQIFKSVYELKKYGIKSIGLHTMICSNELDPKYFQITAKNMFELAFDVSSEFDIKVGFVNLGGGIGVAYREDQPQMDISTLSTGIKTEYEKVLMKGMKPFSIFMENGRYITGPYGYLVCKVIHIKESYKNFAGVDANMANLMRPALYGAYHHITRMGSDSCGQTVEYDVVGSLCENNDKFAIDRKLDCLKEGDFLVIHDAGAHGHSMGFNYNGKLRSAEFLMDSDHNFKMIRRAETLEDYFATLNFKN